ncbi:unnamed protein product [Lepeophtheirus salmonis]|uniref:(salmon louse) hypothetical protein n=1 Tax=Lepeophtheirus salmonis TaxID=72036 RepID=A0A7R8H283_LEPSM|nr:unnamed protein product [Lepeophtheirus salmonis]CAF2820144.1 unnamed protein product [Lepeophtheirus salmonis]
MRHGRNHTPCGRGWNSSSLNNTLNSLSTTHHQSSTRPALNGWQQPFSSNAGRSAARGRGILRGNRSRGSRSNVKFGTENDSSHRSRPHNSTHISDHLQEKKEGKKSAIAETIAMMSKMKMEDKERQVQKQSPDNDSSNSHLYCNNRGYRNCNNLYRGPPPPIMIGLSQRPHHAQGSRFPLNISYTNEGIRRCSRGRGRSGEDQNSENDSMERCSSTLVTD